ncbi:MAG: CorA metal ion transporter [Thelocarpon impressellum]|nr:MAG: CorA metal ion transporter [Thelocarpon impressellum]
MPKRGHHRRAVSPSRRVLPATRGDDTDLNLLDVPNPSRPSFYRLGQPGSTLSNTSLESEALLDHRDHPPLRARRQSTITQSSFGPRPTRTGTGLTHENMSAYRQSYSNPFVEGSDRRERLPRNARAHRSSGGDSDEEGDTADDRTPLLPSPNPGSSGFLGSRGQRGAGSRPDLRARGSSANTSTSSRRRRRASPGLPSSLPKDDYDVNNPPSMPPSPHIGPEGGFGDVTIAGDFAHSRYPEAGQGLGPPGRESVINIDEIGGRDQRAMHPSPPTPPTTEAPPLLRRRTVALPVEGDVCFPVEGLSEIADEDLPTGRDETFRPGHRRRRAREWPDLSVLEEWSREEKEERSEGIRAKKISEPMLVGGRLRPNKSARWQRTEEDAPYRFTYFNEEFASTIHSQTISELLQPGQSFREFFIPDPPELSDNESSEDEDLISHRDSRDDHHGHSANGESRAGTQRASEMDDSKSTTRTPPGQGSLSRNATAPADSKKHGDRPTWWLDVLSPTDAEMRVLAKTFGIHPLTAEDIMMQEAREKVELFRNYYFVNYRTFEQDMNSDNFLQPVEMYVVVFREGVLSFHFSQVPHPANVRRRIRQLKNYLILSSDWISYAIIDDITDAFAPLIQSVEDEVDDIDDAILQLHSPQDATHPASARPKTPSAGEKKAEMADPTTGESGGDMLRRVGDCRKKVMGMYRLLGNKADVIKGFAKRCNEQWEIAPRSEIGLYLGDIQDHIVTMTGNLSHYEKYGPPTAIGSPAHVYRILSRSHSNYLAQINIRMNERQEQTADVLGRLTVLGTIVLPMNIITGLWGMNCLVPGQDIDSLNWFWGITAGLLVFGFMCYFIAKRVYGIV